MTTPDPRIEAVARALADLAVSDRPATDDDDARYLLAAADAVDPLRHPANRAGIAPAGTPTKRIWPDD